jgi:hypothetical protein
MQPVDKPAGAVAAGAPAPAGGAADLDVEADV